MSLTALLALVSEEVLDLSSHLWYSRGVLGVREPGTYSTSVIYSQIGKQHAWHGHICTRCKSDLVSNTTLAHEKVSLSK